VIEDGIHLLNVLCSLKHLLFIFGLELVNNFDETDNFGKDTHDEWTDAFILIANTFEFDYMEKMR
jgi:hypothetical protein